VVPPPAATLLHCAANACTLAHSAASSEAASLAPMPPMPHITAHFATSWLTCRAAAATLSPAALALGWAVEPGRPPAAPIKLCMAPLALNNMHLAYDAKSMRRGHGVAHVCCGKHALEPRAWGVRATNCDTPEPSGASRALKAARIVARAFSATAATELAMLWPLSEWWASEGRRG